MNDELIQTLAPIDITQKVLYYNKQRKLIIFHRGGIHDIKPNQKTKGRERLEAGGT